jgi:hypothetical protein
MELAAVPVSLAPAITVLAGPALLAASSAIHNSATSPTAFYTPPASVPAEPGVLLRSEPFTRDVPSDAQAWLILYTTTRAAGVPAVASASTRIRHRRRRDGTQPSHSDQSHRESGRRSGI